MEAAMEGTKTSQSTDQSPPNTAEQLMEPLEPRILQGFPPQLVKIGTIQDKALGKGEIPDDKRT